MSKKRRSKALVAELLKSLENDSESSESTVDYSTGHVLVGEGS